MARYYKHKGCKLPSVTTIVGETSDKQNLIKWAARMACEYIREYCEEAVEGLFYVTNGDLDTAQLHHQDESQKAMTIGSNVHGYIQEFLNERI